MKSQATRLPTTHGGSQCEGLGHGERTSADDTKLESAEMQGRKATRGREREATRGETQTEKNHASSVAAAEGGAQGKSLQQEKRKRATSEAGARGRETNPQGKEHPSGQSSRRAPRGENTGEQGLRRGNQKNEARRQRAARPPRGAAQPRGAGPQGPAG